MRVSTQAILLWVGSEECEAFLLWLLWLLEFANWFFPNWFLPPVETPLPLFLYLRAIVFWTECWKPEDVFPYLKQQINVFCFILIKGVDHSQFVLHQVHQLMSLVLFIEVPWETFYNFPKRGRAVKLHLQE